jgi:hypothetical protein
MRDSVNARFGRTCLGTKQSWAIVRGLCSNLARFLPVDEHLSIHPKRTCHAGAAVTLSQANPALLVGKTGNEIGRAALIIFEFRHSFQLILGGAKDRVIRIPLLVGSPNRSSSRGGSTCRGCRRPVRCRSCVAVDIFCG